MVCLQLRLRKERGAAVIAAWFKFWIISIVYSSAACAELDGSTAAAPSTPVPLGLDLLVAGLVGSILLLMLLATLPLLTHVSGYVVIALTTSVCRWG